ncbi:MAG: ABC transporter permease [Clostridiales bacterium]|nr:ABC transporter permease [Clostridiales bacterium]
MSRFGYTIKQAFRQVFRNRAMTLASVFAITAMLLILGIFFLLIINVNTAAESVKKDYNTIEVFMLEETDETRTQQIINDVTTWPNVAAAVYRSKDQAMQILKDRWGDSAYLLDTLESNPLPNSIVITVADLESSDKVAVKAKNIQGIEDVKYYKDTVDKLLKVTNGMKIAAMIIMAFLVVVSIVVVSNTIKLTVFARSEEITIMKYVGATNWFIRGPFLAEGIIIGIVSALVSVGMIALVYTRVIDTVGPGLVRILSVPLVPADFMIINLIYIFLSLGISIGAWGSIISMRRFLDT